MNCRGPTLIAQFCLTALFERAQFSHNFVIYINGQFELQSDDEHETSFLRYFLHEVEKVHGKEQGSTRREDMSTYFDFIETTQQRFVGTLGG